MNPLRKLCFLPLLLLLSTSFAQNWVAHELGYTGETSVTSAADLDGDGDIDLISGSIVDRRNLYWFENNLNSTAPEWNQEIICPSVRLISLYPVDYDSDGDIDLVGANDYQYVWSPYPGIVWCENDGYGEFSIHCIDPDEYYFSYAAPVDYNNNGDIDIVGYLRPYGGDPVTDPFPGRLAFREHSGSDWIMVPNDPIMANFVKIQIVDIDSDGTIDFIRWLETVRDSARLLINNGSSCPSFQYQNINASNTITTYLASGDIDSDGDTDIVVSEYWPNKLYWLENDGTTNVPNWNQHIMTDQYFADYINVIDMDGDGTNDILISNNEMTSWWQNDGTNDVGYWSLIEVVCTEEINLDHPMLIDIDGDSDIDICGSYDSNFYWFENITENEIINENTPDIQSDFTLSKAYPNPFNSSTRFNVEVPYASKISINIYNIIGQKVSNIAEGNYNAGEHQFMIDGSFLNSGVYFIQVEAGSQVKLIEKILLIK